MSITAKHKAKETLKELQERIVVVARELNGYEERISNAKSELTQLVSDKHDISGQIAALGKTVEEMSQEIVSILRTKESTTLALNTIVAQIDGARLALAEIESMRNTKGLQIEELNKEILSFTEQGDFAEQLSEALILKRDALKASCVTLEQQCATLRSDIEKSTKTHDEIVTTIDSNIDKFRLFERRIAQFSQETGYIVGYKDPGLLKLKE